MLLNFLNLFIILSVLKLTFVKCDNQITRVNPSETQYYKFNMLTDIKPIRYYIDISMDPILNFKYYNGTSKIEFRSNVNQNFLAFHFNLSHLIDIHDISLVRLEGAVNLTNFNVTYFEDGRDPLIGIESNDVRFLKHDTIYCLTIEYTVRFNEGDRHGFFKFCDNLNGQENNCFATTHFEVHNIRQAFPSFDNATLKAHFNIRVKHLSSMMAVSNMPGRIVNRDGMIRTTEFEESPLMSTYLVAIAIGKFESIPIENFSNISMNLYKPVGIGKSTLLEKYAGCFVRCLENYLDIPFPLPKLDYLASYTASGSIQGMEHWGFISFDGNSVLDQDSFENIDLTENSIKVIGHEIVHQYFGNLVSLTELNGMWLKEGLTTYFTSRISAIIFPNENYIERMFLIDLGYSMQLEGRYDSGVILNNFDAIDHQLQNSLDQLHGIYTKGSAFTNMICHVLGEDSFQKFIQNLIRNFEYDTISTVDFINELQYVNDMDLKIPEDVDISGFVNSWIDQPEFPVVTIFRNYDTGLVEIRQKSLRNNSFWIPFNYATKSNPNFNVTTPDGWLKNVPAANITVPCLGSNDWIIFNKLSTGYYVVNYDTRNWNLIIEWLSTDYCFHVIPPLNRAKLFVDAIILYQHRLLNVDIIFKLLNVLKREHSYITWSIIDNFMFWLPDIRYMEENVDDLISHFYAFYGLAHQLHDTRTTKLARIKSIELACKLKYTKCLEDMRIKATEIVRQNDNFDEINIDWTMFKIIFHHGVQNDDQFKAFLRKVNSSKNKDVRKHFYENLDYKVKIMAFQTIFIITVYDLPSIVEDDKDLRFNLDLLEIEIFHDFTILNDCLLANCYDFKVAFPNAIDRFDRIYTVVEMALKNMKEPKLLYENEANSYATIFEVLDNIERLYGGDIGDRIKSNYNLNNLQLSLE